MGNFCPFWKSCSQDTVELNIDLKIPDKSTKSQSEILKSEDETTSNCSSARVERLVLVPRKEEFLPYFSQAELSDCPQIESESHIYQNGGSYNGRWERGLRSGFGVMTWPNGAVYSGHWEVGMPCGHGDFQLDSERKFSGEWSKPGFIGSEEVIKAGLWSTLDWLSSINEGFGKSYSVWLWYSLRLKPESVPKYSDCEANFPDLRVKAEALTAMLSVAERYSKGLQVNEQYFGNVNDKGAHGFGKCTYAPDSFYLGEWKDGKRHGFGEYTWPDTVITGQFLNGVAHGFAVKRTKGEVKCGLWEKGNLVPEMFPKESTAKELKLD